MRLTQLQHHVKGYRNLLVRKMTCPVTKDESFFQRSKNPYKVIIGRDVLVSDSTVNKENINPEEKGQIQDIDVHVVQEENSTKGRY